VSGLLPPPALLFRQGATLSNYSGIALASAARTATTASADLNNPDSVGVIVYLDVTAIAATPQLTLSIQAKDPASGKYLTLLTGAAVTTVSTNVYTIHPAVTETANVDVAVPLPGIWRVNVVHLDADSITYSVGFSLIG
jgi:hypothetical protein